MFWASMNTSDLSRLQLPPSVLPPASFALKIYLRTMLLLGVVLILIFA